ncbi:hypothetical protein GCM10011491_16500 [Brucella endophytica]|uniref:Pilus assembly protein TadD n=2 Tax=Brucella endophytica TaxID=1963359 RepID=A0A916S8Q0_9HYPH|nr:hypothetical protein GCM10011491_16500 [Brucella endophytica]
MWAVCGKKPEPVSERREMSIGAIGAARRGHFVFSAMVVVLAAGVAGCTTTDRTTTGSIARVASARPIEQMNNLELAGAVRSYGLQYQKDPKNKPVALAYANVLGMTGRNDQALAVMRALAIAYPQDRQVLAAYGKSLASAGELEAALDAVRRAQTPAYPDWRLLSAEGAILDQMGQPEGARALYRRALEIQPNEASILSNFGMSYMLTGDLKSAENYMRNAAMAPGADSRVRQNLALAVGLQGRFQEAEAIARRELSPQQAEANIQYLRAMLAQQNSWNMLKDKPKS